MSDDERRAKAVKFASGGRSGWVIECPGCGSIHHFDDRWTFNGDLEKPTFKPSYLVHGSPVQPRCHSFVTDGQIAYLSDSTHDLAGKTVDLPVLDFKGEED